MKVPGSYFRNDYAGLGANDQALTFADQALISIVAAQPPMMYTEWAAQTSDNTWVESTPTSDYQTYAINDFQLVAVANQTSSEVTTLAAVSPFLTLPAAVAAAFNGTPFSYVKTEAVYAQLDTGNPPQIYFLYWLTLRDASDPKIGPTSLVYAATSIGAVLSYIVETPLAGSDRARPGVSFTQALNQQMSKGPISIPQTPAVQATVPLPTSSPGINPVSTPATPKPAPAIVVGPAPTQAAIAPTSGDTAKAVLLVGLGTAAAVLTVRYFQNRKKAS